MARPVVLTKTLAADDADLLAASQTPVSGTALTLTGAALDTSRRILLTYGNEGSARTLLLTGKNGSGAPITETLAIPSGGSGTVASLQDFATLTSAMPGGGGWTAAATLGTNTVGSTPWVVLNAHITPFDVSAELEFAGTANATVEVTNDSPLMPIPIYQPGYSQAVPVPTPFAWAGLTSVAAAAQGNINIPVAAARLTVNSGTDAVQLTLTQAGIRN